MKTSKIPNRMCVACRNYRPKNELVRLVGVDGVAVVDYTGKMNGRGVYVCKCVDCIKRAVSNKHFAKTNGFVITSQIAAELESLIER